MRLASRLKKISFDWKFFLLTGVGLCVLSVVVFAATGYFFSYDISYRQYSHPLLLLVLLCLLFVGYTGPIFLIIGTILWSIKRGKLVKIIVSTLLIVLLFLFVPFPITCASTPRICNSNIVFPFEPQYWSLAYDYFMHGDNLNVNWHYFGYLYLEEGFGDVANEILNLQQVARPLNTK